MSMFDLNGDDFQEKELKGIFNTGKAGKAENIKIKEVIKKQVDDAPGGPDYKVIFEDSDGQVINVGFWKEPKNEKVEVSRALHVARAVVGKDYKFPAVNDCADAINKILKIVAKEFKGKLFNLYTNYGTEGYPKKYLTVRYFDFIEPADFEGNSKLFKKKDDLLEQLKEDGDDKPSHNSDIKADTPIDGGVGNDDDDWLLED